MIERTIEPQIKSRLGRGRVIVIYGPRRVGKTTISRKFLSEAPKAEQLYLNCDELATQEALKPTSLASLERLIGNAKRIVIDEAQRVENIGLSLKLLIDAHPELDIIATGSSSFDLASKVKEPLTGRSYEFFLAPLSLIEIKKFFNYSNLQAETLFDRLMTYGSYPGIVLESDGQVEEELLNIADKYVYKDSLELVEVRQRQVLPRLLQALALQIGQEVSYNELAQNFGVKLETIERYITLLESCYVIYRLPALSGNRPASFSNRKRKVYFYDLGIRNALIQSLQPMGMRADKEALWENFCQNERMKWWQGQPKTTARYYWRGLYGEVDLIEIANGKECAFEFSPNEQKFNIPKYFKEAYPKAPLELIHQKNLLDWLG
jgi:predicted AAA+ superfamily ATPase